MQIFGLSKGVSVSAVSASRQQNECRFIPLVLCGNPDDPDDPFAGYSDGDIEVMKLAAGDKSDIGPGDFRILKLTHGGGPPNVKVNMAGAFESACQDNYVTKPGNDVGPVVKGLNTRFFDPTHPPLVTDPPLYEADYHPKYPGWPDEPPNPALVAVDLDGDDELEVTWNSVELAKDACKDKEKGGGTNDPYFANCSGGQYSTEYATTGVDADPPWSFGDSRFERRKVTIPIASCPTGTSGSSPVDDVLFFGCFFLLQPVIQKGDDAHVFGEFIEACSFEPSEGASRIVLYKDPLKVDS